MQVHTFNIGIFPGAILPFIIGYWADAATAVGDITATEEASGVEERGPAHDERIQGCLLADGECIIVVNDMSSAMTQHASLGSHNAYRLSHCLCGHWRGGIGNRV